ncbi:uncharacterized protein LOC142162140 [Nicotiana tabacum]|uniref:Uncharacterized protein LOC142162140 n=1 Tax=Nicotiana tabacum TaxID=4097 RepID=A0AC58RPB8_TOBAC
MVVVDQTNVNNNNTANVENVEPTVNSVLDPSDPLYLHLSDNPGAMLVSVTFSGIGYRSWRRAVLCGLSVKNKTGFISGECKRPDPQSPKFRQWERCDDMVTSWILNLLSKEIVDSGVLDITSYYTQLKKFWEELSTLSAKTQCNCQCICGAKEGMHKAEQDRRLIQFLMGLNEVYTADEKQREMRPSNHMVVESMSLHVNAARNANNSRNNNFRTNYTPNSNFPNTNRSRPFCDYCKRVGHTKYKCFKLHGYPQTSNNNQNPRYNRNKRVVADAHSNLSDEISARTEEFGPKDENQNLNLSKEQYSQLINILQHFNTSSGGECSQNTSHGAGTVNLAAGNMNFEDIITCTSYIDFGKLSCKCFRTWTNTWILDSGASNHLTFNKTTLVDIRILPYPLLVTLPNGYRVKAPSMKRPLEIGKIRDGLYLLCSLCLKNASACSTSVSSFPISCHACDIQELLIQLARVESSRQSLEFTRDKFDPRAMPHVLIGYPFETKGYKVLNLQTRKIHISKDVTFHENVFPFAVSPVTGSSFPILPPFISDLYTTTSQSTTGSPLSPSTPETEHDHPLSDHSPVSHFSPGSPEIQSHSPEALPENPLDSTSQIHDSQLLIMNVCNVSEPSSNEETALNLAWQAAMTQEFEALHANHIWDIMPLTSGKQEIGCRWVQKIKHRVDRTVERFKDMLVVKGYTQQLDVNNAFLHGDLHEEVYMQIPPGLEVSSTSLVCKLNKSLYGLKQASRHWYSRLIEALCSTGYVCSLNDYSLFYKKTEYSTIYTAVYVDDVIITRTDISEIAQVKCFLHDQFKIKDLGKLHYFLGLEVLYTSDGVIISQRRFALDLLKEYDCLSYRSLSSPLDLSENLRAKEGAALPNPTYYKKLVGTLNFLTNTRLDIAFSVQHLGQFMQDPREPHLKVAFHLLRNLKSDPTLGVFLSNDHDCTLKGYCDSNWVSCPDSRRLFDELTIPYPIPVSVFCDSQSALHIACNPVFHERTKHIVVDCYFVRDKLQEKLISLHHIGTGAQLADVLTKALTGVNHSAILTNMNDDNDHGWMEQFVAVSTMDIIPATTPSFPESWNRTRLLQGSVTVPDEDILVYLADAVRLLQVAFTRAGVIRPASGASTSSRSPWPKNKQ